MFFTATDTALDTLLGGAGSDRGRIDSFDVHNLDSCLPALVTPAGDCA